MKLFENLDNKCAIFFDYICLFVLFFVIFESLFEFKFVNYHLLIVGLITFVGYILIIKYLFRHHLTPGEIVFGVRTREKQYHRFMQKVEVNTLGYNRTKKYTTSEKARFTLIVMSILLLVVSTGVLLFLKWIF